MKGTRCAIRPEMKATSRERRSSFATTTGPAEWASSSRLKRQRACQRTARARRLATVETRVNGSYAHSAQAKRGDPFPPWASKGSRTVPAALSF